MKHSILLLVCLLSIVSARSQILECNPLFADSIGQYSKAEWDVSLIEEWANPYDQNQIALDMVFISPDGERGVQPCYYVEGESGQISKWKSRFAPLQQGEYQLWFELKSNDKVVSTSPKQSFISVPSDKRGFLRPNDLWTFRFDNGELFRAVGENIGWESRDVDDSRYFKDLHEDKRFNYDYMIPKLSQAGGNFFRTWMIYWNLPVDWKQIKNNDRYEASDACYNESAMNRLDHLVEMCDSLGVYMMLALESHVGYMDEGWDMSNYNVKNGGFAQTPYEFFTKKESRDQYKNKLRLMIARYGYSPSIAEWEFFNEVDHVAFDEEFGAPIPTQIITDWHREMSEWLKSCDPYQHMVTTSVSHRDMDGMNDLSSMDFNQRHIYGYAFTIPEVIRAYEDAHHKPYVIGESGYHWDWSLDFNEYLTEFCDDFRKDLWLGLFSPTPILPMSWWWEFFEDNGMMEYFATVQIINQEMLDSLKGSAIKEIMAEVPSPAFVLAAQCGPKAFVYVNNDGDTCSNISVRLAGIDDGNYKIETYNTKTQERVVLSELGSAKDQELIMPEISLEPHQDCVFIFTKSM